MLKEYVGSQDEPMVCKEVAMKVVIIGGVAAGATAATRLRRLDERAEIVMLDKGPHVSFSNCSLPFSFDMAPAGKKPSGCPRPGRAGS